MAYRVKKTGIKLISVWKIIGIGTEIPENYIVIWPSLFKH